MSFDRRVLVASVTVLVLTLVGAALTFDSARWNAEVFVVLLVLATASDRIGTTAKGLAVTGSFVSLVLAMALLGPSLAALIGVLVMGVDGARRRVAPYYFASNLATYALFPFAGGWAIDAVARTYDLQADQGSFALIVVGGYLAANALNFAMVAGSRAFAERGGFGGAFRTVFVPLLPNELASGLLAAGVVFAYAHVGVGALGAFTGVILLHQWLTRELLVSQDRAEELEQRITQLASLHMGVMSAMVQTLALRDKMTARHSAAVARFSRELAAAAGCSDADQDLVHTAGLLHDIGKFIFPDHILLAARGLDDEDWETVKRHPAQGAKVVRQVEGYGPVADIILCHHEKIDGTGYPRGLSADEIPLLSRIISVADTYDVMTARDSYRDPVSSAEAVAELRRVAGAQLDARLVELFIGMLEAKNVAFRHADDADFEVELAFEKRVREYVRA